MQLTAARTLALTHLRAHGLTRLGWTVTFDQAKNRAGQCNFRSRQISLSSPIVKLNDAPQIEATVLHEIAHALVGPGHGHDAVWQRKAKEIGGNGKRCFDRTEKATPAGNVVGTCPRGHTTTMHKRPQRVRSCGQCSPRRFSPHALYVWTDRNGRPLPMLPAYVAELARLQARFGGKTFPLAA